MSGRRGRNPNAGVKRLFAVLIALIFLAGLVLVRETSIGGDVDTHGGDKGHPSRRSGVSNFLRNKVAGMAEGGGNPSSKTDLYLPPVREELHEVDHLIIVAGHAIFRGANLADWANDNSWILEPFQIQTGGMFVRTLIRHMQIAVLTLAQTIDRSMLVFSGGQTRKGAGPRSEGLSYYELSEYFNWFQDPRDPYVMEKIKQIQPKVFAEEYARDSFENVLFSIARFYELTGRYPKYITVVGFEYKRQRFAELHRQALNWPEDRFHYIGMDMADVAKEWNIRLPEGNAKPSDKRSYAVAKKDPFVCKENHATRQARNPYRRTVPYYSSCPELQTLLHFCGPEAFTGELPWDHYGPVPEGHAPKQFHDKGNLPQLHGKHSEFFRKLPGRHHQNPYAKTDDSSTTSSSESSTSQAAPKRNLVPQQTSDDDSSGDSVRGPLAEEQENKMQQYYQAQQQAYAQAVAAQQAQMQAMMKMRQGQGQGGGGQYGAYGQQLGGGAYQQQQAGQRNLGKMMGRGAQGAKGAWDWQQFQQQAGQQQQQEREFANRQNW